MTIELLLGPRVDEDAIDLVLDLERRGYDVRVDGSFVRPRAGLTVRDADRLRRYRRDVAELVAYVDSPPVRPWSVPGAGGVRG